MLCPWPSNCVICGIWLPSPTRAASPVPPKNCTSPSPPCRSRSGSWSASWECSCWTEPAVVRLTDGGETYAQHARRALRDLAAAERALQDVKDLSHGRLRLAVTPTFTAYLVGPLLASLRDHHPGITLALQEMTQDHIESGLLSDDLDLGFAFAGDHLPGIKATPLFTETLSLVTGTHYPNALPQARPLPVRDVAQHDLALLSADYATRNHIDAYFTHNHVTPHIAVETNSIQTLIDIIQRTPLATVLPNAVTDEQPRLIPIPLNPPPARTVTLLRRADAYQTAAALAFTRLTHDFVKARAYPPA